MFCIIKGYLNPSLGQACYKAKVNVAVACNNTVQLPSDGIKHRLHSGLFGRQPSGLGHNQTSCRHIPFPCGTQSEHAIKFAIGHQTQPVGQRRTKTTL